MVALHMVRVLTVRVTMGWVSVNIRIVCTSIIMSAVGSRMSCFCQVLWICKVMADLNLVFCFLFGKVSSDFILEFSHLLLYSLGYLPVNKGLNAVSEVEWQLIKIPWLLLMLHWHQILTISQANTICSILLWHSCSRFFFFDEFGTILNILSWRDLAILSVAVVSVEFERLLLFLLLLHVTRLVAILIVNLLKGFNFDLSSGR